MAQDKRHDLAPHALRLWVKKLEGYKDCTICRALEQGRWDLFPSVDDVLKLIDQMQERAAQDGSSFRPCAACINGWITVEINSEIYKSGKARRAERCECWREWAGVA